MPLTLPRANSLRNFDGGYDSNKSFATLPDNATEDAENVIITRQGGIAERKGYRRMLNTALTDSGLKNGSTTVEAVKVKNHFQLVKSGGSVEIKRHVVHAGKAVYQYTSQTASIIASLSGSNVMYFAQIQDPRDGTDDVVVMTNGNDEVKLWNGTESSAVNLSAQTSATGVVSAKFVASLKNRIYLLNVNDSTDVDSNVKVLISAFSDQGVPRPQRFEDNFYVGGADKTGPITGAVVLKDQLIIFKRNATYKFSPGAGRIIDTAQLVQMDEQIGCIAPGSIAVIGNAVLFLGELGVYAFDGNNFTYVGDPIEKELADSNRKSVFKARGIFYRKENQYWLSYPSSSGNENDTILVFDLTKRIWFPPYTGLNVTTLSTFLDSRQDQRIISGDQYGFLHKQDFGYADGVTGTFTGYISEVQNESVILDNTADFPITGDGIGGTKVRIVSGTGQGKEYTVIQTRVADADLLYENTYDHCSTSPSYVIPSASLVTTNAGNEDASSFKSGILSLNDTTDLESFSVSGSMGLGDSGCIRLSVRTSATSSQDFVFISIGNSSDDKDRITLGYSQASGFVLTLATSAGSIASTAVSGTLLTTASFTEVELNWQSGVYLLYINGNLGYCATISKRDGVNGHKFTIGRHITATSPTPGFDMDYVIVWRDAQHTSSYSPVGYVTQTFANAMVVANDERVIGLDTTSKYLIGGIKSYYKTKDFDFGAADTDKKFRKIMVRTVQKGDHNLSMQYIVDFNQLSDAPTATISLYTDGALWNTSVYSVAKYGGTSKLSKAISLRAINTQSLTGKNFAVRFSNDQPFQPWEINGLDIITKEIGRR